MSPPLVSVIIPVYNTARYLRQCLDSLLSQTLHDLEIICINDGSSDDSPRILDEYAGGDGRIRVIHKENGGASVARNTGLALVRAPYVGFVDADDWVERETFKTALYAMQTNAADLVCWGNNVWVERDEKPEKRKSLPPRQSRRLFILPFSGKHALTGEIRRDIVNVVWNKLYRTDLIRAHDITFPASLSQFEDFVFNAAYFAWAETGVFLNRHYYNHRSDRSGSIMTRFSRSEKPPVYTTAMQAFSMVHDYYASRNRMAGNAHFLSELLAVSLGLGLWFSADKSAFLEEARRFAEKYPLPDTKRHTFRDLRENRAFARFFPFSFAENVFSVTNIGNKKVFRLFGMDMAFDRQRVKRR